MSLEKFKILNSMLSEREAIFVEARHEIEFSCHDEIDQNTFKDRLTNNLGINVDPYYPHKLRFAITQLDYNLYWGIEDFRLRIFAKTESGLINKFSKDLAIIDQDSNLNIQNTFFFDSINKITLFNLEPTTDVFLFQNSQNYLIFLQFLKAKEHNEDGFFHFVDHFSWDNEVIVFVSATKEGKLTIPFKKVIPEFDVKINLADKFERFFEAFDENDKTQKLPKFIKAELFKQLSIKPKETRLISWIDSMDEILTVAHQNFDIYLSDLSITNVKKQYLETKDKYFAQLREILGKISSQIIALPLSISAVALASYTIPQTQNKPPIIFIITAVFVVYTFFALFLLKIYREDIEDASEQFEYDFRNLENDEFFQKYPSEQIYFENIKVKLTRKLNTMRVTLWVYIILLIFTNGGLLWKLLAEIDFYPFIIVFVIEILFLIFIKVNNKRLIG